MCPGAWSGRSQRWRGLTSSDVTGPGLAAACRRAMATSRDEGRRYCSIWGPRTEYMGASNGVHGGLERALPRSLHRRAPDPGRSSVVRSLFGPRQAPSPPAFVLPGGLGRFSRGGSASPEPGGPRTLSRAGATGATNHDQSGGTSVFDLKGKVAGVTGGDGGIGLGMARERASAGAQVVVVGRNEAKSRDAVKDLEGRGTRAFAVAADVGDEAAVGRMVEEVERRCGRLDILVNNAGTNIRKPAHELELAEWSLVLNTNLTSAFLCSKAAYPLMRRAGGGKIINIGSMMSIFGASFAPAYGASKGGIVQLTRSLAVAWAKDNIQVNAVLPGWIDTELTRKARAEVPGLNENVLRRTPAGRWGTWDDCAGIAVFLAAPASDFVTGTAIPLDGGFSVQS